MKLLDICLNFPSPLFTTSLRRSEKTLTSQCRSQATDWMQKIAPSLIVLLGISILGCSVLAFCTCLTALPGIGLVLLGALLFYWAYHQMANIRIRKELSVDALSEENIQ
ncbi:hypothetical protein INQ93_00210 [Chlamydia suis]|uniref:hypothetical protein n=1 Tax=Chlamydia suis TaxID=83559 RepID=UPI0009AF8B7C|nr:hypothetical protein [Chlamydia suis]QYC71745.1 hypothetical protein INQ81_00205 [Chlamydia suis]QYC72642.1 hypothetical protein INQ82_00205 [Chlamydia suis]QYC73537.1 hypothetical protein INQ83_00205 [Chlamydia suis]QYC78977.1 hypothetical protein INQ89_00205 [Chlamydia suis]QYC79940.1 hypothetical protein INQ90_00205 [Chlamydia suis]